MFHFVGMVYSSSSFVHLIGRGALLGGSTVWNIFLLIYLKWVEEMHYPLSSWRHGEGSCCNIGLQRRKEKGCHYRLLYSPVPLTIFRSNSKFDQNLKCSSLKYTKPITTIFCTRHDSVYILNQGTANFGRISNSIEISLVGRAPGPVSLRLNMS